MQLKGISCSYQLWRPAPKLGSHRILERLVNLLQVGFRIAKLFNNGIIWYQCNVNYMSMRVCSDSRVTIKQTRWKKEKSEEFQT